MATDQEEIVLKYKIDIDALKKSVIALREKLKAEKDTIAQAQLITASVRGWAKEYGVSTSKILKDVERINEALGNLEVTQRRVGQQPRNAVGQFAPKMPAGVQFPSAFRGAETALKSELQFNIQSYMANMAANFKALEPPRRQVIGLAEAIKDMAKQFGVSEDKIARGLLKTSPLVSGWSIKVKAAMDLVSKETRESIKDIDVLQQTLTKYSARLTELGRISRTKGAGGTLIGDLADQIQVIAKESGRSFEDVGRTIETQFGVAQGAVRTSINRINQEVLGFRGILDRVFGGPNVIAKFFETAFGTATAILIFNLQQTIANFFTEALKKAKDFEREMREIKLAETVLSEGGIEITIKDFEDMVDRLDKKFGIFAKTDLRNIISQVATLTQDFGLSADQIERLSQSIIVAKLRRPDKNIEEIATDVVSGLIQGRSQAIRAYSPFGEEVVKSKAIEMGLATQNQELTEKQKLMAGIEVLWDSLGTKSQTYVSNLEDSNELIDLQSEKLNTETLASWGRVIRSVEILLKSIYLELAPVITAITEGARILALYWIIGAEGVKMFADNLGRINVFEFLKDPGAYLQFIKDFWNTWRDEGKRAWTNLFSGTENSEFVEAIGKSLGVESKAGDTPTGTPPPIDLPGGTEEENKLDNLRKKITDLTEALDEFGDKAREAVQDFNRETSQLNADFLTETERNFEDYQNDIADVWAEYNSSVADNNRDYRNNELNEEAKFLEDLRQLREKFLFNLEDALRERDARQVLRLQRQYQMDKENLTNEFELGKKERERQHKEEMSQAARRRDERLAELQREFDLKKQREQEDFDLKMKRREEEHQIEMERLNEDVEDKLRTVANALAEELDLDVEGAEAIYRALSSIYGPGGKIGALFDYTYANLIAKSKLALNAVLAYAKMFGQVTQFLGYAAGTISQTGMSGNANVGYVTPGFSTPIQAGGQAEGGAIMARSATQATFGEAGPELAMFIPFNKMQSMFGGIGGRDFGGGDGAKGNIGLEIMLSPDLEARIIQKSLNGVAATLNSVRRSR